jgi:PIN domain nuclease of toxin-antitoxin system
MTILLDTHFLIWTTLSLDRLAEYPWLDRYRPWGVSPVSFLELQFLAEIGRLEVRQPDFEEAVGADPRFVIDEVPLLALVRQALAFHWTRDPFDRLLAAHSLARRVPLCTVDRELTRHHALVVGELSTPGPRGGS